MAKEVKITNSSCLNCDNYMDCRDRIRFGVYVNKINAVNPSDKMKSRISVDITCGGFKKKSTGYSK